MIPSDGAMRCVPAGRTGNGDGILVAHMNDNPKAAYGGRPKKRHGTRGRNGPHWRAALKGRTDGVVRNAGPTCVRPTGRGMAGGPERGRGSRRGAVPRISEEVSVLGHGRESVVKP